MTANNLISPMKCCYNTSFTLPKQSQRSRSILHDESRSLRLLWKEKTLKKYGIQMRPILFARFIIRSVTMKMLNVTKTISTGSLLNNSTFSARSLLNNRHHLRDKLSIIIWMFWINPGPPIM